MYSPLYIVLHVMYSPLYIVLHVMYSPLYIVTICVVYCITVPRLCSIFLRCLQQICIHHDFLTACAPDLYPSIPKCLRTNANDAEKRKKCFTTEDGGLFSGASKCFQTIQYMESGATECTLADGTSMPWILRCRNCHLGTLLGTLYTPLIHSSHTLLSYTPLIHSSHPLLS
jgi:hypothetical protein